MNTGWTGCARWVERAACVAADGTFVVYRAVCRLGSAGVLVVCLGLTLFSAHTATVPSLTQSLWACIALAFALATAAITPVFALDLLNRMSPSGSTSSCIN